MAQTARKKLDVERPRRRKPRRVTRENPPEEKSSGNEPVGFVLGVLGLFLLLAIASHIQSVYDSADLTPQNLAKQNLVGVVGYQISDILFKALGWCSFASVLWLWLLARSVWRGSYASSPVAFGKSAIGSVIMAIAASTVAALFWDTDGGGALGITLSSLLLPYLNTGGTILFALFIFTLSFVSSTGVQIGELLGFATSTSKTLTKGAAVSLTATSKVGSKALQYQLHVTKKLARATTDSLKKTREGKFAPQVISSNAWDIETDEEREFRFSDEIEPIKGAENVVKLLPAPPVIDVIESTDAEEEEELEEVEGEEDEVVEVVKTKPTLRDLLKRKKKGETKEEKASKKGQDFNLPPFRLLGSPEKGSRTPPRDEELLKNCKQLEKALSDFKVGGKIVEVQPGPVITLYEFEPAPGVKVQRIVTLADDLALALKVASVRVYAPVPGKGTVGIEVPNAKREIVFLQEILDSEQMRKDTAPLTLALGKDTFGDPFVSDLAKMPHLLIAGATGTGKSVCINSIILSLLYRNTPETLRLLMIDPKMLELSSYERIPHLKAPVVTNPKRARGVLWWAVEEMERRYRLMVDLGVRNLDGYNRKIDEDGPEAIRCHLPGEYAGQVISKLPSIVIIVDELADLMLTVGREIEELLTRLAQKARAAGIHLILATQRPSVNVITGLIKANFPSRISFKVASRIDSRTVLDGSGAERLLGQGDMLFVSSGAGRPRRLHGAFVSDNEVHDVVNWWRGQGAPDYDPQIEEMITRLNEAENQGGFSADAEFEHDPLYDQALQLVVEKGQASTSMIQRVFRIGYNRAARILEMMEREGVVGPADGAKPRQILAPSNTPR